MPYLYSFTKDELESHQWQNSMAFEGGKLFLSALNLYRFFSEKITIAEEQIKSFPPEHKIAAERRKDFYSRLRDRVPQKSKKTHIDIRALIEEELEAIRGDQSLEPKQRDFFELLAKHELKNVRDFAETYSPTRNYTELEAKVKHRSKKAPEAFPHDNHFGKAHRRK